MKRNKKILITHLLNCLLLLFIFADTSHAAFQLTSDVGARPIGMNGAYSAVADDVNSIVYNVAGLGKLARSELITSYASLYPGVNDSMSLAYIAFVQPLSRIGTIGVSGMQLVSNLYGESVISVSYGREIPVLKNVYFGLSLKNLGKAFGSNSYTSFDPTFASKTNCSGLGIDFGLLFDKLVLPELSVSVTGKNVNQPDIALKKHDIVPAEYRIGAAYKTSNLILDIDGLWQTNVSNNRRILVGGEYSLFNRAIALRSGAGVGNNNYYNVAIGFSCSFNIMQMALSTLDYSFNYNPVSTIGTGKHQVSLSFKF